MQIIDLTHTIHPDITVYPGTPKPVFDKANTIKNNGFAEMKLTMVTHTGTHIDAPSHILEGKKSLDDFPVDHFFGKAIVIHCADLENALITFDFIKTSEDRIRDVDFVLFHSGWSEKWMTDAYFEGFPVLTSEAAKYLTQFHLKGIGLDCISIDRMTDEGLPNHHIVLGKDILIIENLANLDRLPETGFIFQCLPMKIKDADGAPVRAVAILGDVLE